MYSWLDQWLYKHDSRPLDVTGPDRHAAPGSRAPAHIKITRQNVIPNNFTIEALIAPVNISTQRNDGHQLHWRLHRAMSRETGALQY